MDSDDRERLDVNMDTLRKNEEKLKLEIGHQIEVVNSMYDFLNSSALQMNSRLSTFYNHIANISEEINKGLTTISKFSEILILENNLAELRVLIDVVAQNLKTHQENMIRLLLNEHINTDTLFDLIEPNNLFKILEKAETALEDQLYFPRKKNGNIYPELIGLLNISHQIIDDAWVQVTLLIPLVDRRAFSTFKASFTPGILDSIVAVLKAPENILILEENSPWGLEVSETELNLCKKFRNSFFCTFPLIEHNMNHRNTCVAGFYFHNITLYCETTYLKTSKEVWFQSSKANTWTYVAPKALQLEIINGEKSTHITVYGVGNVSLTQGMSIRSENSFIQYNELSNEYLLIEVIGHNFTFKTRFNQSIADSSNIPVISLNESVYSSLNMKQLFDLGTNARDLKNHHIPLQNIDYDPLNYPWHIASAIIALIVFVCVIFCCCLLLKITGRKRTTESKHVTIDLITQKVEPIYATPSTNFKNMENNLLVSEEAAALPPPPPPPLVGANVSNQSNSNINFRQPNLPPLTISPLSSAKIEENEFGTSSKSSLGRHKKKISAGIKISRKNR